MDKDRFAVQIAALRLWLSLAIDSDEPRPLPNLDYKIGCGDSLLAPLDDELQPDMYRAALVEQFRKLKDEHANVFDYERKKELHDEIELVRGKLAVALKHAVALDGDKLLAAGDGAKEVATRARELGVKGALIVYVEGRSRARFISGGVWSGATSIPTTNWKSCESSKAKRKPEC